MCCEAGSLGVDWTAEPSLRLRGLNAVYRLTGTRRLRPPGPEGLFVHKVSRTSKFDPRVFLLGQTILNAEDSFGIVSVNGGVEG